MKPKVSLGSIVTRIPVDWRQRRFDKLILFVVGLLASTFGISAQPGGGYLGGDGTIVSQTRVGNETWTIRRHAQRIEIGDLADKACLQVRSDHSETSDFVGELKIGDTIDISYVAEATANDRYIVWLRVATGKNVGGWILLGKYSYEHAQFRDPYFRNRWEVTGYISTSRTWTVRRMSYQRVAVFEKLNIRDKPGLKDTKVISVIVPPERNPQVNLDVSEVTEETETIDGRDDRWLRIVHDGIDGWIFGGYADVMRGGYKYHTPANIIRSVLGYAP